MKWNGKKISIGIVVALALVLALGLTAAQAVDELNLLELDRDAVDSNGFATLPDDWDTLYNGNTNTGGHSEDFTGILPDFGSPGNQFQGGGSKDNNNINQWLWKPGEPLDKDDITDAYAAAYTYNGPELCNSGSCSGNRSECHCPGDLIIFFGLDRFANNGSAQVGFWFLQNNVFPSDTPRSGGFTFSGVHAVGDILVQSNFTQGGTISNISIFEWVGSGGDEGTLQTIFTTTADCSQAVGHDPGCAIVNTDPESSPWLYTPKSGTQNVFPQGSFFEGGINITRLIPGAHCFTTFIAETRSSTPFDSRLKDFVRGEFKLCGLSATKDCPADGVLNECPGPACDSIHYKFTGTVTNTGVSTLFNVTIVDTLPGNPTPTNVVFYKGTPAVPPATPGLCDNTPLTPVSCPAGAPQGSTCVNLGSLTSHAVENWCVEFDSTSLSVQNNASARGSSSGSPGACTSANTFCSTPDNATCSATPQNSITISKNCGVPATYPNAVLPGTQLVTESGLAAVRVNFSGIIQNTGQTTLNGITLTDSPTATITVAWPNPQNPGVIPAGGSAKYSGYYLPSGVTPGDLGGAAGRYSFADEIKVTGATATLGADPGSDPSCVSTFTSGAQACAGTTCNICPASATCSGN